MLFAYARTGWTPLIIISLAQSFFLNTMWLVEDPAMPIKLVWSIIIIAGFYIFFFYLNTEKGSSVRLYKASLLGGLSYIIYLIHGHFGYLFLSKFANESNKPVMYLIIIFLVIAISYFIHIIIEKRLSGFWTVLFKNCIERPVSFLEQKLLPAKNTSIGK